jgi:glycosidase
MFGQRRVARRLFSHYMLVYDDVTGRLLGHWIDIGPGGFRLETIRPVPPDEDFRFRVDLSNEIANKSYMVFKARSRWCQKHEFDLNLYDAGFQIDELPPDDARIFHTMIERYGSRTKGENYTGDYLWK